MQLSQADADLAELRGKLAAQQATVSELQARVDQIPEIEAELVRLNRDYDVNKQQFDTLLQRRESARITEQAEQSAENVKFRVIEPPALPLKATGPKRVQLGSMVLVLALASGLGLAVLLAQLRPTFASRDILQQVTGLPVLGTVTAVFAATVVPWYRREEVQLAGALSLLFVVYALNLILQEPLRDAISAIAG
jgi:capsular polysaccharide biosynthesis protein